MNKTYRATDLRIGNLLQDNLTKAILRVELISPGDVHFLVLDRSKYPLPDGWHAEGIPLTPEILKKCGFQPDELGDKLKISETAFLWQGDLERMMKLCFNEGDCYYPLYLKASIYHFQYLHQLQNLYFALTGRELKTTL